MRRTLLFLVAAFALLVAACASPSTTSDTNAPSTTAAPSSTAAGDDSMDSDTSDTSGTTGAQDEGSDTTSSTSGDRPPPEGPAAPDFTLALGADRSEEFVLSQEVTPVFMVFWAEW